MELCERDSNFLGNVIKGDESWAFEYDLETKRQTAEWYPSASLHRKKARMSKSKVKTMLIAFLDISSLIHYGLVPHGTTVNDKFYVEALKRVKCKVHCIRPDIMGDWKFRRDNMLVHTAFYMTSFVTNSRMQWLPSCHTVLAWLHQIFFFCFCF